jgi:hypothetical protein
VTYCTNVHAGESWPEVRRNIERHVLRVKQLVAPDQSLGVGLRLSARAAETLSQPAELEAFRDFLAAHGLYVFTINGFPYGLFHSGRVKEAVYLPDWTDEARLHYTDQLATLLAALLPDDDGLEGSISTVPGAFKTRARAAADVERIAELLLRHVAMLHRLASQSGKTISLALEPEPCCLLETTAETIAFFERHLFSASAVSRLATLTGLDRTGSEMVLRRHAGVCVDACHAAVEFEEPADILGGLRAAGIRVAKLQISAGLELRLGGPDEPTALEALRAFAEDVYLHQVVERSDRGLRRFIDLPDALADAGHGPRDWRIHFHVPVFHEQLGLFRSTQAHLRELLGILGRDSFTSHLEIETYTWDVLPEEFRRDDVTASIGREFRWLMRAIGS